MLLTVQVSTCNNILNLCYDNNERIQLLMEANGFGAIVQAIQTHTVAECNAVVSLVVLVLTLILYEVSHNTLLTSQMHCGRSNNSCMKCQIIPKFSMLLAQCNANIVQYPYDHLEPPNAMRLFHIYL
jgi:hypothetical protein